MCTKFSCHLKCGECYLISMEFCPWSIWKRWDEVHLTVNRKLSTTECIMKLLSKFTLSVCHSRKCETIPKRVPKRWIKLLNETNQSIHYIRLLTEAYD